MKIDNIYKEKIFSKWTTGMLAFFLFGFLLALAYQILVEPIGAHPAPNWLLLLMFLFFLGMVINFSKLLIIMTPRFISLSYGIFKYTIFWENVSDCYRDKASIARYGGWGIRIGRVNGKWRLVYNVAEGSRVVLLFKKDKFFKEFVFSTKNPDEVIRIVKQQIGRIK